MVHLQRSDRIARGGTQEVDPRVERRDHDAALDRQLLARDENAACGSRQPHGLAGRRAEDPRLTRSEAVHQQVEKRNEGGAHGQPGPFDFHAARHDHDVAGPHEPRLASGACHDRAAPQQPVTPQDRRPPGRARVPRDHPLAVHELAQPRHYLAPLERGQHHQRDDHRPCR